MTDTTYDRRAFMAYFGSIGLGASLFPGVLWAQAQQQAAQGPEITKEMIASAEEIEIEVSDAGAVRLVGDAEALRVMLGNLVDNAIHYTPARGAVQVAIASEGGGARLVVTDTGPGIAPEERERVFDRFYRGAAGRVAGSGLGLAIVRRVTERHGARIELGSGAAGRGLKVTVRFPAAPGVARL